jgi:isopentenyl-diphosphate delta-isomerase
LEGKENISKRKKDHIDLAFRSRTGLPEQDMRFNYEPILAGHSDKELEPFNFLGKQNKLPMWVSSMTGGTGDARHINQNLAKACNEFGFGMGLGSCRPLLESDEFFEDFNLRPIIGDDLPFYANLGIAQLEKMVADKETGKISDLVGRLRADGLIIHVNPLQEWLQPEGDHFSSPPLETISAVLETTGLNIIVKEVGQGMGPESLKALLKMPIAAIEFGAYGGTNFAKLELLRSDETKRAYFEPISRIGHSAAEMVDFINDIAATEEIRCRELIISGGITSFIDGFYLVKKSRLNAVYGQASTFLKHAKESYDQLSEFIKFQINGLKLAESYFRLKSI